MLETIESEGLVEAAARKGEHLAARLADLAARHERHVEASRGQGLLQALVLRESVDARALLGKLRDAGVLLTIAGGHALRFSPPLVVTEAELDEGVAVVDRTLGEL